MDNMDIVIEQQSRKSEAFMRDMEASRDKLSMTFDALVDSLNERMRKFVDISQKIPGNPGSILDTTTTSGLTKPKAPDAVSELRAERQQQTTKQIANDLSAIRGALVDGNFMKAIGKNTTDGDEGGKNEENKADPLASAITGVLGKALGPLAKGVKSAIGGLGKGALKLATNPAIMGPLAAAAGGYMLGSKIYDKWLGPKLDEYYEKSAADQLAGYTADKAEIKTFHSTRKDISSRKTADIESGDRESALATAQDQQKMAVRVRTANDKSRMLGAIAAEDSDFHDEYMKPNMESLMNPNLSLQAMADKIEKEWTVKQWTDKSEVRAASSKILESNKYYMEKHGNESTFVAKQMEKYDKAREAKLKADAEKVELTPTLQPTNTPTKTEVDVVTREQYLEEKYADEQRRKEDLDDVIQTVASGSGGSVVDSSVTTINHNTFGDTTTELNKVVVSVN